LGTRGSYEEFNPQIAAESVLDPMRLFLSKIDDEIDRCDR
jgi:hypothetical protein